MLLSKSATRFTCRRQSVRCLATASRQHPVVDRRQVMLSLGAASTWIYSDVKPVHAEGKNVINPPLTEYHLTDHPWGFHIPILVPDEEIKVHESHATSALMKRCATWAGDYTIFYGMASPPTSYGGYGGNANEKPKYTFEYPAGWKSEMPSKVRQSHFSITTLSQAPHQP